LRALSGLTGGMTSSAPGTFKSFLSSIQSPALRAVAHHWHEARGRKRVASWDEIPSSALSTHAKLLWAYAYDRKLGAFTGRFTGKRWGKWVGMDFHGKRLEDIHSPANYRNTLKLLTEVVTTPLASRSSGCLFKVDSFVVTGERIILPLGEDGQTADGVLGASDYAPPPLKGTLELILENPEWYAI